MTVSIRVLKRLKDSLKNIWMINVWQFRKLLIRSMEFRRNRIEDYGTLYIHYTSLDVEIDYYREL